MDRRIFSQPILMEKQASSNTKINNKHLVSIICSLIGEQLNIAVRSKRSTYKRTTVDEFHILNVQKEKEKKKDTLYHQLFLVITFFAHGVVVELVLVREVCEVWEICESCESRASTLPFPPLPKRLRS